MRGDSGQENGHPSDTKEVIPDCNLQGSSTSSCKENEGCSEELEMLLEAFAQMDSPLLDLSHYQINTVPSPLMSLSHIEYLYLSNNRLQSLPETFFSCLPNLKWLDLRYNYLRTVPKSVSTARKLVSLLLGHNQLTFLPIELCAVKTLNCLNVCENPLQFPPKHITDRGLVAIMKCLKQTEAVLAENNYQLESFTNSDPSNSQHFFEEMWQLHFHNILTDGSSEEDIFGEMSAEDAFQSVKSSDLIGANATATSLSATQAQRSGGLLNRSWSLKHRVRRPSDELTELNELRPRSASLQKRKNYSELRQERIDRIHKAGASGRIVAEVSGPSSSCSKVAKDMRDNKQRDFNIKVAIEEQRLKNKMQLEHWRQDLRDLQRRQHYLPKEPPANMMMRTEHSPYAVDKKHLKLKNRSDMTKSEESNKSAALKNVISPRSKQEIEKARALKDADLEKRIKMHALAVQSASRPSEGASMHELGAMSASAAAVNGKGPHVKSGGTHGQMSLADAKRDLDIALQLQRELQLRKSGLTTGSS